MHCCEACFDDEFIKEYIRRNGRSGTCQYCRKRGKHVIEVAELQRLFERFTSLYSPVEVGVNIPPGVDAWRVGERLASLIQEQWGIFSERLADSGRHHDLLREILTANRREEEILDASDVSELWTDRNFQHNTLLDQWHELADELKHPEEHKRIMPELQPTEDDLATATDTLQWFADDIDRAVSALPAGSRIYRARLGYREDDYRTIPIPETEMGAPPPELVKTPGRANPVGVSYFYGAEDERTAVAEIRPHRGMLVTVAVGETLDDLRLIDLAVGMRLTSPFECGGEYLRSVVESCELFNHLDSEFGKPLRSSASGARRGFNEAYQKLRPRA